tara:strand:- start:47 stop:313 length:267 start_codon:yes stop_codon:yes gene_type:complete
MINKNDLQKGTQFVTKHSENTVFTIFDKYICSDILFKNKISAISANQYSITSITNKYLKMYDIQFGQVKTYTIKLEDIKIINITYNKL